MEQCVSIKIILDRILRHPLMQDISLETVVDYTIDFMRIMGVPSIFMDKVELLQVNQYRALLPCDYYQMIQVRLAKENRPAFRYSGDSFHLSPHKHMNHRGFPDEFTYKIQGGIIYTSLEKGCIEIAYEAIATDEDGYPLIPDNSSFTRALELYIKKQWFIILFDQGKISPAVLNQTLQDYAWAAGDCQSEFNRLSLDKAESFYNSWRTLIMRDTEHVSGFRTNGAKEKIKVQ